MVETVIVKIMSDMTVPGEVVGDGDVANSTFSNKALAEVDMWGMYISAATFHLVEFLIPVFALISRWRMLRRVKKWGKKGYIDPGVLAKTQEAEVKLRLEEKAAEAKKVGKAGKVKGSDSASATSALTSQEVERADPLLEPDSNLSASQSTGYDL